MCVFFFKKLIIIFQKIQFLSGSDAVILLMSNQMLDENLIKATNNTPLGIRLHIPDAKSAILLELYMYMHNMQNILSVNLL